MARSSDPIFTPAFIFMPDISGFTRFVNETDIIHSTHIITELLEAIINANELDLTVSEIEGDAVLFYKAGKQPPWEDIIRQTEKMFTQFHLNLKRYRRDRLCNCGACSTASNLSLKFVAHYGDIGINSIDSHIKLMGPEITLAHRLLKNSINENEYLLTTENVTGQSSKSEDFSWVELTKTSEEYDDIGSVKYAFFSISPMYQKIEEIAEPRSADKINNPASASIDINVSLQFLHSIVTDITQKPAWVFGISRIVRRENNVPRVGTTHTCVLPITSVDMESVNNMMEEGRSEYAERIDNLRFLPTLTIFFIMDRIEELKSRLTIELHHSKPKSLGFITSLIIKMMSKFMFTKSLKKLKKFSEEAFVAS